MTSDFFNPLILMSEIQFRIISKLVIVNCYFLEVAVTTVIATWKITVKVAVTATF